jgi:4-hydroxy-tetrahydrodipicolinate synthase
MVALSGVLCALVTPLTPTGEVDLAGLDRLLDRVVRGGVAGICPVGSTGEGSRLTAEQRATVVARVRDRVPAELPVIPTPGVANPPGIPAEIDRCAELGADAALVPPPPHYALTDAELRDFYRRLADTAALPVVIYNFPKLTGVPVPVEVVRAVAGHERIAGIKDSGRDFEYTTAVRYATAEAPGFALLTGSDTMLLATVLIGGAGAVCGSANLVPELGRDLYAAAVAADLTRARVLQRQLFNVVAAARAAGFPAGWKAALELAGVCAATPAAPAAPLTGDRLEALRGKLTALGVPLSPTG